MPAFTTRMDNPMDDSSEHVPIASLWIRRQLFEHSVAVPLLTSATAAQVDFPRLISDLVAADVTMDPAAPPAVSFDSWVAAAGLHARLDSSEHASVIIEALETNAPQAFVRCNDPEKLAAGRQLNYRLLLIPVPELVAFVRLHAAAIISARFRENADSVWPEADAVASTASSPPLSGPAVPSSPPLLRQIVSPIPGLVMPPSSASLGSPAASPASPRVSNAISAAALSSATARSPALNVTQSTLASPSPSQAPGSTVPSPPVTSSAAPPGSPGLDGFVRKKTPVHLTAMINSQSAILASVEHSLQRETHLVASNIRALLASIASTYGLEPDEEETEAGASQEDSGAGMGGSGAIAVESGTLGRDGAETLNRRVSYGRDGMDVQGGSQAAKAALDKLPITRGMFEHLSFLLTTTSHASGAHQDISDIVPQWQDKSSNVTVPLGTLVGLVRAALVRVPQAHELTEFVDMAEIRDLDRKTILRSALPETNSDVTSYPHGREVRISNCSESHFYLLSSFGRVSMIACRDCTLFIGSCVSVSIINCVNVRVHAIARVCRVTNCFDTHMYLCTNRFPQIVGENRGLLFAPYNAAYAEADAKRDLAAVGVDASDNVWDKYYRPAHRRETSTDGSDPDMTPAVAAVLQPEHFLPFAIPVKPKIAHSIDDMADSRGNLQGGQNTTVVESSSEARCADEDEASRALFDIPLPLPPAYAAQLTSRCCEIKSIRREIRSFEAMTAAQPLPLNPPVSPEEQCGRDVAMSDSSSATPTRTPPNETERVSHVSSRGLVQALVQDRFREWLNTSGNMRQITDLVRLDQDDPRGTT